MPNWWPAAGSMPVSPTCSSARAWLWRGYNTTYDGAPTDGSAWASGNCAVRVTRGGAWTDSSINIRFARRLMDSGAGRFSSVGFQVARAL